MAGTAEVGTPLRRNAPVDGRAVYVVESTSSGSKSPLVFGKADGELALVQRAVVPDLDRRETHIVEPTRQRQAAGTRCYVPSGLASELFRPLWAAVFSPKKLQKRTVACLDIERMCIALLNAAKADDRPFLAVGCHIKGLCVILSQKLQMLAEDAGSLSRKLLVSTSLAAISGRPKSQKTYREADGDYEEPKRRRHTAKARRPKKQMLALEDYFESGYEKREGMSGDVRLDAVALVNCGVPLCVARFQRNTGFVRVFVCWPSWRRRDYMPMDQVEVLQLMNFGIGLGVGTDIAFYSASSANKDRGISYHNFEHGMVDRQVLSLEALQNRETVNPEGFVDLQSLSSPFKLSGYSFTPRTRFSQDLSDVDTTIASTELSLQSESVVLSTPEFGKYDLDWDIYNDPFQEEEPRREEGGRPGGEVVPVDARARRMVLEYTGSDGKAVHLVKSRRVARYDATVTCRGTRTPRKARLPKEQKTLDTFAVSPLAVCDKTHWFASAIDSLVKSVMGNMPSAEEEPAAGTVVARDKAGHGEKPAQAAAQPSSAKQGDKWFKTGEKEAAKATRPQSARSPFDPETVSTVQLIEGYRARVRERQNAGEPIEFGEVLQGRSRENAAMVFYRTLVLANAGFVTLSQANVPGATIAVTPARRFWEPIQPGRDFKA
ncbi:N terminus of Rad21/Rec8 like protein [Babesia caballi]|uniref:N terminus of Rad21/Rec8 like protein n=1 Tax=Babesia caballi TaxID=5871 RepID=A0AAV4LZK1_BABCB|nr:N terminus of Rad21/Rec8 like protein [Babesia caballi]